MSNEIKIALVIHPRTPEEAVSEFQTDIARRIRSLNAQKAHAANTEVRRIQAIINELNDMLQFWLEVKVVRPIRQRKGQTIG